jgi:hypothetical protein
MMQIKQVHALLYIKLCIGRLPAIAAAPGCTISIAVANMLLSCVVVLPGSLQVICANMRQELTAAARSNSSLQLEDSCTDVLLNLRADGSAGSSTDTLLVGHNEDMTRDTVGNVFVVRHMVTPSSNANNRATSRRRGTSTSRRLASHMAEAGPQQHNQQQTTHKQIQWDREQSSAVGRDWLNPPQQELSWVGFVYAGELPTSAFGFNTAGIGFTLNAVFPADPLVPGVARNFVSRALLEATSIDHAMHIIRQTGQVQDAVVTLSQRRHVCAGAAHPQHGTVHAEQRALHAMHHPPKVLPAACDGGR